MAARDFIISQLSAGIAGAGAPAGDVSGENGERYPASRPAGVERVLWRVAGIRAEEMGWLQYLLALLLFNALGGLALFALLMLRACCRLTRSTCRGCHGIWRSIPRSALSAIPTGRLTPAKAQ